MRAKSISMAVALITVGATSVYAAATGSATEDAGPLVWSLIGFGVLVILVQAIPAAIMLYSVIKGLSAPAEKPADLKY